MAVGLVLLCAGLPPVVTGPLLGRMLDRWSLRQVLIADNLLRAGLVGAIPTLHWLGRLNMPLVCGLMLAAGALLPATDVGALVGPAVGGPLVGLVGAPPVLLLDAVSLLAMAALVGPVPDAPTTTAVPPPARSSPTRPLRDPTVRRSSPSPWSTSWLTGRWSPPCPCTAATCSTPAPAATAYSGQRLALAHGSAW